MSARVSNFEKTYPPNYALILCDRQTDRLDFHISRFFALFKNLKYHYIFYILLSWIFLFFFSYSFLTSVHRVFCFQSLFLSSFPSSFFISAFYSVPFQSPSLSCFLQGKTIKSGSVSTMFIYLLIAQETILTEPPCCSCNLFDLHPSVVFHH